METDERFINRVDRHAFRLYEEEAYRSGCKTKNEEGSRILIP